MKRPALIIIKPDGISKKLIGKVFAKFDGAGLEIVAIRAARATRKTAQEHYRHLKGQPFFEEVVSYLCGKFHKEKTLLIVVYYGEGAIKKCRAIAGATSPKDAAPESIRGSYGRITKKGLFENIVHVSSDDEEAQREIKLWFDPSDILVSLYPTRLKTLNNCKQKVWS